MNAIKTKNLRDVIGSEYILVEKNKLVLSLWVIFAWSFFFLILKQYFFHPDSDFEIWLKVGFGLFFFLISTVFTWVFFRNGLFVIAVGEGGIYYASSREKNEFIHILWSDISRVEIENDDGEILIVFSVSKRNMTELPIPKNGYLIERRRSLYEEGEEWELGMKMGSRNEAKKTFDEALKYFT